MSLRENAKEIASHGRFGDDRLLHVSKEELRGLAALVPGGQLPINPKTGLPEAFFFLPFLFGAAAPAAAAAGAAAAPALAATTAGLGAAAGAGGLGALTAGMQAGMTAAGGLGALGATAPAALTAATALPAATTTALAPTVAALPAATQAASTLAPTALGGLAGAAPTPAIMEGVGGLSGLSAGLPAFATPTSGLPAITPSLTGAAPAVAEAPAAIAPAVGGAPSWAGTEVAPAVAAAPPAAVPPASVPGFSYAGTEVAPAAAQAAPVTPAAAEGGILGGMDMSKMLQYAALGSMMLPKGGGGKKKEEKTDVSKVKYEGGEPTFPGSDYEGGIDPEWDYFRNETYNYAEGGLAQLLPPESAPPPPKGDEELIEATVAALQGKVPNPQEIIQQFIATFGQTALQDLMAKLGIASPAPRGDGMSDGIPALLQGQGGQAPARLSEGEYVMPADVVSGLGNGSTQAGANALDQMSQRVRAYKNGGRVSQPPALNPRGMMPY